MEREDAKIEREREKIFKTDFLIVQNLGTKNYRGTQARSIWEENSKANI